MTQLTSAILTNLSEINGLIGYACNAPIGEEIASEQWKNEFFRRIDSAIKAVDAIAIMTLESDRTTHRKEAIHLLDSK
jgi:hypothetical protein